MSKGKLLRDKSVSSCEDKIKNNNEGNNDRFSEGDVNKNNILKSKRNMFLQKVRSLVNLKLK